MAEKRSRKKNLENEQTDVEVKVKSILKVDMRQEDKKEGGEKIKFFSNYNRS